MADVTQELSQVTDLAAKLQAGSGSGQPALDLGVLLGHMSTTFIVVNIVAGLVGTGYYYYGKKTNNLTILFSGVALCIVPMFISNTVLLIAACVVMAATPFAVDHFAQS
jgi:hypothetical protein